MGIGIFAMTNDSPMTLVAMAVINNPSNDLERAFIGAKRVELPIRYCSRKCW